LWWRKYGVEEEKKKTGKGNGRKKDGRGGNVQIGKVSF